MSARQRCIGEELLPKFPGFGPCSRAAVIVLGCGHNVCQYCGEVLLDLGRIKSFMARCSLCVAEREKLSTWERGVQAFKLRRVS